MKTHLAAANLARTHSNPLNIMMLVLGCLLPVAGCISQGSYPMRSEATEMPTSLPLKDRPQACAAGNWIALGDGFGIAVTEVPPIGKEGSPQRAALKVRPDGGTITGHMMVRREGVWFKFAPEPGPTRAVFAE